MNAQSTHRKLPIWTATYLGPQDALYSGSPLTDTLPPLRSQVDWVRQLLNVPSFDVGQRDLPSHVRAYHLADLKRLFIPDAMHTKLAQQIDLLIRWGYDGRRLMSEERHTKLQKTFERCQASGKMERMVFNDALPISSSSVIGISGMGKSTTVKSILGSYPQCIHHPEYGITQVVWLKVECPKDGSTKELGLNILRAFDAVLGTSHETQNARGTADELLNLACHLAVANHLGVLALDELQNLSAKKSGGREAMLNWLQELVNDLTVPVILLGTFKVRNLLKPELRHARRACVLGSHTWDPLKRGEDFAYANRKIWDYYWLREPSDLNAEMLEVIYVETQGIRGFMVDMFLVAQLHALWKGYEVITAKFFREVARDAFAPVQPALNALRSNQADRLRKFEDLMRYEVEDEIERVSQLITTGSLDTRSVPISPQATMTAQASSNLERSIGIGATEARQWVMKALNDSHETAAALTRAASQLYWHEQSGQADHAGGGASFG